MRKILFLFCLVPFIASAQIKLIDLGSMQAPFPNLVVSPSSLTVPSSTAGSQGASDSAVITGSSLGSNTVTVNALAGYVFSADNSIWTTTLTFNTTGTGTINQKFYQALASGNTAGPYNGNVNITSALASCVLTLSGTTNGTTLSAIFNFSSTASSASNSTNFFGDPTTSPSFTGTNGWTLTAIGANWSNFGGFFGGVNNGARQASSDGNFTQAQGNSNMFTQAAFSTGTYNLEFTNLPAGTYDIILWGSVPDSIFDNGGGNANFGYSEYHVRFGPSGSDNIAIYNPNNNPSNNIGNLVPNGPGTTNVTTGSFTGTITAGQFIYIEVSKGASCCTGSNGQIGWISALKIIKH
jgi:hypothetical protein